jgi:ribosomal protein S18 acetylase RimI-like enzyme
MPVVYRPAHEQELEKAEELVVRSINELTQRHGFGQMASLRPAHFQLFSLRDDPDGLWVAEDNGEILGFTFSWICDDLWFLAELFVAPGQQGRGIGNDLLARTLAHASKNNVAHKALITFAFNTVSQGLYVRHGLLPRLPLSFFEVSRESLLARLQDSQFRCDPLNISDLHSLARIDAHALGVSREKHHRYLMADDAMKGFLLHSGTDCVGYVYVNPDGHIGPLAVTRPDATSAAFQSALTLAAERGSPQVTAFIPGTSDAALGVAVGHGMRITFPMVLMSSRDFGDWTCYLPRNPGFM